MGKTNQELEALLATAINIGSQSVDRIHELELQLDHRRQTRMSINIYNLHKTMTAHLFPAFSSTDERFLALALCGEAGELANMIKKRWRDGADLSEEIRDEIADIRVYLELLAKCFAIEGDKLDERVQSKLQKVVEKHNARTVRLHHTYMPSWTHMGDCAICGYRQDSAIHK